jgi:hypothetical protein
MTGRTAAIRAGTYRRRVLVRSEQYFASADMEDDPHRFGVDVHHDGSRVVRVVGRAIRVPWSTCPFAAAELSSLAETPLLRSPFDVLRQIDVRKQCTHMADMAAMAIAAAARGVRCRQFDIALRLAVGNDDERLGHLAVDVESADEWLINHGVIEKPARYSGINLTHSSKWIDQYNFSDDERDELFVMRRAHLVSGGRRFDLDEFPLPADSPQQANVCFTYQAGRSADARRQIGSTRDFTRFESALLADLSAPNPRK